MADEFLIIGKPTRTDHIELEIQAMPDVLHTNTVVPSKLAAPGVAVRLGETHLKSSGGLLATTRQYHVLETGPFGWKVEREFSDVTNLREALRKQFPGHVVSLMAEQ